MAFVLPVKGPNGIAGGWNIVQAVFSIDTRILQQVLTYLQHVLPQLSIFKQGQCLQNTRIESDGRKLGYSRYWSPLTRTGDR